MAGGDQPAALDVLVGRLAPHLRAAELVRAALVHRSFCAEHPGESSNERLEFLGDSVLGLCITEALYLKYPGRPEGDLARLRAELVSTTTLARLADELGVGSALLLGRGEAASGGRKKASILADTLEALIGATYLSGGLASARGLVEELFVAELAAADRLVELGDAKNRLQELCARRRLAPPIYRLRATGPDHDRWFVAEVEAGSLTASGEGHSKKQAERAAATAALAALND